MNSKTATTPKLSRWTVAAIVLACVPLVVLALCIIAAMLGVHDNQGIIYAFMLPFGAAVIAWPLALICRAVGLGRDLKRGAITRTGVLVHAAIATSILGIAFVLMRWFGAF